MTKILQSIPYPTYTTAERDLLVDVLKNTYINNSDTDKIIRWMRLPELEVRFRFPFIMIIYLSLVFLSVILAVELGK